MIKEAYLHETTAHHLVTVDEILLHPKETVVVPMKFETWRGQVPNFKNKPALVSTAEAYVRDGLIIDEIVTNAHKNGMTIRVTNKTDVGTSIPCHAQIASFQILPDYNQRVRAPSTNDHEAVVSGVITEVQAQHRPDEHLSLIHI